ncbi:MAG: 30S ribosomal protein S2 [Patescibacteria group bacterium]
MREITLEQLLEAGCHFGHQVTRSNPKARDFIYEARDNIHIIDLVRTKQCLEEGATFIKSLAEKEGSSLIIVGTKRQAKNIVEEEVKKAKDLFYISNRWVGGLLTNFDEVSKNFKKLKELSDRLQNEELKAKYTKKEIGLWAKEKEKLEDLYGGVVLLTKKPDALFIIDSHLEELAVREAIRMGVTTVAIVDTNADPDLIDYPIPANDDAVGSIKLITSYIIDSWIEGRKNLLSKVQVKAEEESKEEQKATLELEQKQEVKTTTSKTAIAKSKTEEKEGKDVKRKPRTTKKTS